jgi:hypothetical protein
MQSHTGSNAYYFSTLAKKKRLLLPSTSHTISECLWFLYVLEWNNFFSHSVHQLSNPSHSGQLHFIFTIKEVTMGVFLTGSNCRNTQVFYLNCNCKMPKICSEQIVEYRKTKLILGLNRVH